jgi:hypothetical protein
LAPDSQLYVRYNGAMLGLFLDGAFFRRGDKQYETLRRRMAEFLAELEIELTLPATHAEYRANYSEIKVKVLQETAMRSVTLAGFAALSSAVVDCVMRDGGAVTESIPRAALRFMDSQGISCAVLDRFAEPVREDKDGLISLDRVFGAALAFVDEILVPLPREPDTAFVAMPFSEERFLENFPTLYAPLLRELDCCAIRAWGSVAEEDYQEIIPTLISRCGVLLADLTTHAPNVLHEVGIAHAQDQLLLLVAEGDEVSPPSNLANLMVFRYERKGSDWHEVAVARIAIEIAISDEIRLERAGPNGSRS